jgi:ABC-type transport system involved in cytochrome c biogenesis permease component
VLSFPLITRELRVQSRNRGTYGARLGWGTAAVAVFAFFAWQFPAQAADGKYVLTVMHFCLGVMFFLVAPIGAADAISREKREGTLGILLLTRLTPRQVVLGKLAAHLIRLFYFGLLLLPFLMVPVLLGGVTFGDFVFSAVVLCAMIAVGISAGLIASALLVSFGAALGWAMTIAAMLTLIFGVIAANGAMEFFPNNFRSEPPLLVRIFIVGPGVIWFPLQARQIAGMFIASPQWFLLIVQAGLLVLSFLSLLFSVVFSSRKIAEHSEFAGETKRTAAFRKRFLTPIVWRDSFRKSMRERLDRNPFVWLEYRAAWARAARWAMVLGVIVAETRLFMALPELEDFLVAHFYLVLLLVLFMTFKCASSFQREKESGAFELLLVTPLTERRILGGRLQAVASYYSLAVVTLVACAVAGRLVLVSGRFSETALTSVVMFLSVTASSSRYAAKPSFARCSGRPASRYCCRRAFGMRSMDSCG